MEAKQSNFEQTGEEKKNLSRRNFITYTAGASSGLIALALGTSRITRLLEAPSARASSQAAPTPAPPAVPDVSRVTLIRSRNLLGGERAAQPEEINKMLGAGIRSLFGTEDPVKAWRSLFSPDDVVGIKVNCIAGPELSTDPRLVAAIISELEKIPIPPEQIIVWDRTNRELARAGYAINVKEPGMMCCGTDAVGYEEKASSRGSFRGRLSKILTRRITALINVPILKNHGGAGVTIAMKNHYGSIHNPGRHHGNLCDPYIADLNSLDEIRAKTSLIVCDATRATCNGGPGYHPAFAWRYGGLILSRDPVALDAVGTKIIDERRSQVNLPTLAQAGRHPRFLASAAERGLGNADAKKIELQSLEV